MCSASSCSLHECTRPRKVTMAPDVSTVILRFNLRIALECVLDFDLDVDCIQGRLDCDLVRYRFDAAQDEQLLQPLPFGIATRQFPEA